MCAFERDRECEWVPGMLPCLHTESALLTDGRGRAVTVTELELSERELGGGVWMERGVERVGLIGWRKKKKGIAGIV